MSSLRFRKLADATATRIITAGGMLLIIIIVGMMGFIFYQALPLWYPARIEFEQSIALNSSTGSQPVYIGVSENRRIAYDIDTDGFIHFSSLAEDKREMRSLEIPLENDEQISIVSPSLSSKNFAAGTTRGRVIEFSLQFKAEDSDERRTVIPILNIGKTTQLDSAGRRLKLMRYGTGERTVMVGIAEGSNELLIAGREEDGEVVRMRIGLEDEPTALVINDFKSELMAGFEDGSLRVVPLSGEAGVSVQVAPRGTSVTALEYLIGEVTLIVGDAQGNISGWMNVRNRGLQKTRDFGRRNKAIIQVVPSWRNKCFVAADAGGGFGLYHSTSERLLSESSDSTSVITHLSFAPKADGLVLSDAAGIKTFHLINDHPEVSWGTLFSKIWYESYDKPEYTWQSSGGTDDFEPKLSMIPLIFGTIKATLYAMLFAIPMAVLGALYTSQFAHPRIRTIIKPTVEIMAALPSVVIGFIAGLWLAPLLRDVLVEFVLVLLLSPLIIILLVWLFNKLPTNITSPFRHGYEVVLMIPAVILAVGLCYLLGNWIETAVFNGDVPHWLYTAFDIRYDQRNSIVIGVAMAFATMPIIFTITEDSLSSVPVHLTSASLALGASRWQTAVKVVLPAASAGIFSAIMIGLGRAVGETMIVLMATGNTPIMDWSIFNGMRTLSANIAVEIPEAPQGGSLYRTLFLSGLILFIMTFFVNTVAELIRQRLRKKYASM